MTILEAVVLGIIQGMTEFLPVSSSGHLALMQHFLGLKESQVFFDVMLHLGTLGAVVIAYKESIRETCRCEPFGDCESSVLPTTDFHYKTAQQNSS